MNTYKKTPMAQISICETKKEDLTLDLISENIKNIEGEECIDKILAYVKTNFKDSSNKSIKIIEKILMEYEYEHLLDYSNELFLEHPKVFIDYFKKYPESNVKNALTELYGFFTPSFCQDSYKKINGTTELTEQDMEILKSINLNLSSK